MVTRIAAILLLMGTLCTQNSLRSQATNENFLANLMMQEPEHFGGILKQPETWEVQIIYTRIDRDKNNSPSFTSYYFNHDEERYFYPASTVKMPVALLALERMNELGLDQDLYMLTDSAYSGQSGVRKDATSASGMPSVAHYIKKIFVVSDNDAYNRLFEFLGPEYILDKLQSKGYDKTRIIHRLSIPLSEEENRHTNPVTFQDASGNLILHQEQQYYGGDLNTGKDIKRGKGYIRDGQLINEPMDFTRKNFFPLDEMQRMLRAVLFPETATAGKFDLTKEQMTFLYQYMSQLPGETRHPVYDPAEYYDAYSKFLLYGNDSTAVIPDNIRIFNKIGLAYGFAIDNAYIIDTKNNVEFLLSAVIHTNKNQIYNDGEYEYETTAFPFMKNLGRLVYQYELKRLRENTPDLSRFELNYDMNN